MKLEKKDVKRVVEGGGAVKWRGWVTSAGLNSRFFMKKYHIGEDAIGHKLNYL